MTSRTVFDRLHHRACSTLASQAEPGWGRYGEPYYALPAFPLGQETGRFAELSPLVRSVPLLFFVAPRAIPPTMLLRKS